MTSEPNPRSEQQDSDRCWLYLLGDMNERQTTEFEAELAVSTTLQQELDAQANLIVSLPTEFDTSVRVAGAARVRQLTGLAAIAATFLIAILCWPTERAGEQSLAKAQTQPESLLIAQAWAEGNLGKNATSLTDLLTFADDEELDLLDSSAVDSDTEEEGSFSWIVAAVEAGAISDG